MTDSTVRRRENTRARLLAAALEVLTESSPDSVSVDQLVQAAGFTRGAFYSNFSTMDEVFTLVFEAQSERMLETIREILRAMPTHALDEELIEGVLNALRPLGRRWFILHSELQLKALRDPDARALYQQFHPRFRAELVDLLEELLSRLGRRATVSLEALAEVVAVLYMSSLAEEELSGETGAAHGIEASMPQVILSLSEPLPA